MAWQETVGKHVLKVFTETPEDAAWPSIDRIQTQNSLAQNKSEHQHKK